MIGAKVREAVAVRSHGRVALRTLSSTLSELESLQRVSRDMMCLDYLKRVLMGVMWKRSYCMLMVIL